MNVGAANEHQSEDGAEARDRAKDEEPELAAQRKAKLANENAAEDHPDNGRGNHHHTFKEGIEVARKGLAELLLYDYYPI